MAKIGSHRVREVPESALLSARKEVETLQKALKASQNQDVAIADLEDKIDALQKELADTHKKLAEQEAATQEVQNQLSDTLHGFKQLQSEYDKLKETKDAKVGG